MDVISKDILNKLVWQRLLGNGQFMEEELKNTESINFFGDGSDGNITLSGTTSDLLRNTFYNKEIRIPPVAPDYVDDEVIALTLPKQLHPNYTFKLHLNKAGMWSATFYLESDFDKVYSYISSEKGRAVTGAALKTIGIEIDDFR